MFKTVYLLCPMAPLIFSCCHADIRATPQSIQSAGIGVSLAFVPPRGYFGVFKNEPDEVYFARAETDQKLSEAREILVSNYVQDHRAYLLNPKPGRYFVVGGYYETTLFDTRKECKEGKLNSVITEQKNRRKKQYYCVEGYTVILPDAMIKLSEVSIEPARMHYAGDYVVRMDRRKNLDPLEGYFLEMLEPGFRQKVSLWASRPRSNFPETAYFWKHIYFSNERKSASFKNPVSQQKFLEKARKDFNKTRWTFLFENFEQKYNRKFENFVEE